MKKDNPMLKKALEEAARQELSSLPEERQIIRPYSDKFEKDMQTLLGKADTAETRKRPRVRVAALIAAVLVVVLTVGTVGAVTKMDLDFARSSGWTIVGSEITGENETEMEEIIYDGKEIVINYTTQYAEDVQYPDSGIMITVNGIRQTFDVKTKGDKAKNVDFYVVEAKPGETKNMQLTFTPNIGKKGDVMSLAVLELFDPMGKCCPDRGAMGHINEDNDNVCDKCSRLWLNGPHPNTVEFFGISRLVMNEDVTEEVAICKEFSGATISPVAEIIKDCYNYEKLTEEGIFNEYDEIQHAVAFIYNDFENQIYYDKDAYYSDESTLRNLTSTVSASKNEKLSVNVHGKGGKYRVSFYIDTEIQPVFNGCDYLDIEFADGEQVTLDLNLDTSDMKGEYECFVLFKPLDDVLDWTVMPETCYVPHTLMVE